jgi:hypothetical protein
MNDSFEDLEKRLKSFYEGQTLDADVLVALKQSVIRTKPEQKTSNWFSSWFSKTISLKPMALALVISLFFLFGGIVFTIQNNYRQTYFIASEIAINHQKEFHIEFQADEITDLAEAMPKLDFTPIVSTRMDWPDYQIIGSRYCTIDSAIATQIRLKDIDNQAYTLYQFRPLDSVTLPDETTLIIDDVTVTIWYEGGLIMGLAQTNRGRERDPPR